MINLLIDQTPTASVYALLTCRPEFQPDWSHRSYLSELSLNRLTPIQIEQIATQVSGGKTLPAEIIQQLVEKTDGVPLYVEEMTKAVLESGVLKEMAGRYELASSITSLSIPSTLQDSLMARLDRLVTAKGVAQYASVIGRQFSYELLQAVSGLNEIMLQHELARLVEAELVYQRGLPPQSTYVFKHALIQDTAYESLLRSTRQGYHRRIAELLEEKFPEVIKSQPELVAHHFTEASLHEQAIDYWHKAGEQAVKRLAYQEATAHLNRGLKLLNTLPDSSARSQGELLLLTTLGPVMLATKGHGAQEVEQVYSRAHELVAYVGETPQRFQVLWGLRRYYHIRAEFQVGRQLAEQLVQLAQEEQSPVLLVPAYLGLGLSLVWLGEFSSAHASLEKGFAFYAPQYHHELVVRYGDNPGVSCLTYIAKALWFLGFVDQAKQHMQKALHYAQERVHPYTLAWTLYHATEFQHYLREVSKAKIHAEAAITLCAEQSFPMFGAMAAVHRGWSISQDGQIEEGLQQIQEGLSIYQKTGAEAGLPYHQSLLAEIYGRCGQAEEGLQVLNASLRMIEKTGERFYEAEIHRLKGKLLLQQSPDNATEAESCFQKSISIAQNQSAKSLELRSATSLARLWKFQRKNQEAYDLLVPVYNWFTEGFDTADLIDAKALLVELEEGQP